MNQPLSPEQKSRFEADEDKSRFEAARASQAKARKRIDILATRSFLSWLKNELKNLTRR